MILLLLVLILLVTPTFGATLTDRTVAFYHGAPDRAGAYIVPSLNWHTAASVRRVREFDGKVEGHIYAQPLYWHPSGGEPGLIIAATESNLVYALDADTGRVVWRTVLGHPVQRSTLPCGNIDPLGITGTPVIDADRGVTYLNAMVDDHRGKPRHLVFGLRLSDGSVLPGFPIDITAGVGARGVRFDPAAQNQRGALALLNGRIFVPFGGHYGDCSDYHGVVVALTIDRPQVTAAWALATLRAARGEIITAPAVYPLRGSVRVAYQAHGAVCPNGSYATGIGVLVVTADPSQRLSSAWCARMNGGGAPIVTTIDGSSDPIVWAVGAEGDERLHGFRGDNGQELCGGSSSGDGMSGLRHFVTILVAEGRFYIAGDGRIFAFQLPR